MSTVSSCAFCEQEGHLAAPSHPSETARCTSTGAPQPRSTPSLHPPTLREWPDCRSLRASNEGFLRPRVARAQEINRLHPLLCSGARDQQGCHSTPFTVGPLRARRTVWPLPI